MLAKLWTSSALGAVHQSAIVTRSTLLSVFPSGSSVTVVQLLLFRIVFTMLSIEFNPTFNLVVRFRYFQKCRYEQAQQMFPTSSLLKSCSLLAL